MFVSSEKNPNSTLRRWTIRIPENLARILNKSNGEWNAVAPTIFFFFLFFFSFFLLFARRRGEIKKKEEREAFQCLPFSLNGSGFLAAETKEHRPGKRRNGGGWRMADSGGGGGGGWVGWKVTTLSVTIQHDETRQKCDFGCKFKRCNHSRNGITSEHRNCFPKQPNQVVHHLTRSLAGLAQQ